MSMRSGVSKVIRRSAGIAMIAVFSPFLVIIGLILAVNWMAETGLPAIWEWAWE